MNEGTDFAQETPGEMKRWTVVWVVLLLLFLLNAFALNRLVAAKGRLVVNVGSGFKVISQGGSANVVSIGPVERFVLGIPPLGRDIILAMINLAGICTMFVPSRKARAGYLIVGIFVVITLMIAIAFF